MSKIVGGEFALSLNELISQPPKQYSDYLYASGRSALYYIGNHIIQNGIKRIWLPSYLCHSITETLIKLPLEIIYYSLGQDFLPNFETVSFGSSDCFLIINYFGLLNTETTVSRLKRENPNVPIIVDNVQAYFEMNCSSLADYQFTSFRKTLGAPDGAWVIARHHTLIQPQDENSFSQYKIAGALLKKSSESIYLTHDIYMRLIEQGECLIDSQLDRTINRHTLNYLASIDMEDVKQQRRTNSQYVLEQLKMMNICPMIPVDLEQSVPLFIPIQLNNRDAIRKALAQKSIYCPIHWNDHPREISLVIDQRYEPADLKPMIGTIKSMI